jgi:putative intracellular protease/amidase
MMPATIDRTASRPKHVMMVVASPRVSEMTGWRIGFWASELAHPWYEFREAGYDVTVASPDGGKVEMDFLSDPSHESGYSAEDVLSRGFFADPELTKLLEATPRVADLDLDAFDAILVCGGAGPMYQFREDEDLQRALAHFYEAEKPTASLCHGISALIDVRLSDGSYLIDGKTMTGFANVEEDAANEAVGQTIQPWRVEDAARERGANFVEGGLWKPYAVRDGRLLTGQQQYSGRKIAELVIEALGT